MSGCCGIDTVGGVPAGGRGAAAAAVDTRRLLPAGPASAAPLNLGISNVNAGVSTYVAPVDGTTLRNATERQRWTSAVGAGSTASHRNGTLIWNRDAFGGFTIRWVVTLNTLVNNGATGFRGYVGLLNSAAVIPAANPSTLTNAVGFYFNPSDTPEWIAARNDGLGAMVGNSTGLPVNTTDMWLFEISAEAGGPGFDMSATNLTTGAAPFEISYTSNIPAAGLLLAEHVWLNTNGDATTAAQIDVAEIVSETRPLAA